jgi:glycosyltransferase involved in cell wall biosynthesis
LTALRIAIDATAVPQRMAGAGVYTYQLVRALAELDGEHSLLVFARTGLFDDLSSDRLQVEHVRSMGRAMRLGWEQALLPLHLRRQRVDVLHSPHHHTPLVAGIATGVRQVVTFHDVTFLLLPHRYPLVRRLYMSAVTRASARAADAFIAPSQAVRNDVVRELGLQARRVFVVPEAAAPHYKPADGEAMAHLRQRYGLPNRYLLSVGSLEPGKNRARLIEAYSRLHHEGIDVPLVVAGQRAWDYEGDFELVRSLGLDAHVRFLGYVPDDDLPALYSGALLLAFPSLYEGFGLPVLEAMACGTPVLTSSVSATAEVAADAALLVHPLDVNALTSALGRMLTDDALRAHLRRRGLARAAEFSWERTAQKTLWVYGQAMAKRS